MTTIWVNDDPTTCSSVWVRTIPANEYRALPGAKYVLTIICSFSKLWPQPSPREVLFFHEVSFRKYLLMEIGVKKGLFIDCLGSTTVNEIEKNLLGFNQSNIILALISCRAEMRAAVSVVDFIHPL